MAHYDEEAFERDCRAMIARQIAIADAAVEAGNADTTFVIAQKQFTEARVQFALACVRAENLGCAHDEVIEAAAMTLGMMHGSTVQTIGNRPDVLEAFNDVMLNASESLVYGIDPNESTGIGSVRATPMKEA